MREGKSQDMVPRWKTSLVMPDWPLQDVNVRPTGGAGGT